MDIPYGPRIRSLIISQELEGIFRRDVKSEPIPDTADVETHRSENITISVRSK
jgi:hypothetical protein